MLPLTKALYEHPRTQMNPVLRHTLEVIADWDRFRALSRGELALHLGILAGALMMAFHELDTRDSE